jgi:hypothetical protein
MPNAPSCESVMYKGIGVPWIRDGVCAQNRNHSVAAAAGGACVSGGLAAPLGNAGKPARTAPIMRVRGLPHAGLQRGLTQRVRGRTRAACIPNRRVQFAGRAEADCVLQPLLRQRN